MGSSKGNWLLDYQANVYSQSGEDGVLKKIFALLNISKGWCVEFGAWDGIKYSNTYHLIESNQWSSVHIEGNSLRFKDLQKTFMSNPHAHLFCEYVGFDAKNSLNQILKKTPIPKDFDLLSIDIDGNDIHIWDSFVEYLPKVVIIEYNPTIPNHVDFEQPASMNVCQGSSLKALIRMGKKKGYELIAVTGLNAIFVLKELYPLFSIEDNSIDCMRERGSGETSLFQLYDGTIVVHGNKSLIWSGFKLHDHKIQILPAFLRYFETNNVLKRVLRKCWRYLNKRKLV